MMWGARDFLLMSPQQLATAGWSLNAYLKTAKDYIPLPAVGLHSMSLLFTRFLDESKTQYPGSLGNFWVPKSQEALSFKFCYDWHVVERLSRSSNELKHKDRKPFSTRAATILCAATIRATSRHLPQEHFWRKVLDRWEEWTPEVRTKRERQERMSALYMPLVVYEPRPKKRQCLVM
ncbi:hypothetical protein DOTSEDRAFT_37652 [Dothistroma septosporum NZE10]|uniref:Uncharacterized protein n=1 Tax=Dothistroma septosporum (strain NZE10 / CBS 128990) TaxID=675120 RepID=N1PFN2_DOTSN|nr:hypothetical protein DOTSEDRAFT_37652 [Dothistroma septosporum NZE10]